MSEQTTYTQEQVNQAIEKAKRQWEQEVLKPIIQERDELMQYKPKEKTPEELEIERLKAELLQQKVVNTLKQAELDDFIDFLNVESEEELQTKIDKLSKVLDERKLKNSYVPQDRKTNTDQYSVAKKQGDNIGMLKALFNLKNN